jgi:hypothetical protein
MVGFALSRLAATVSRANPKKEAGPVIGRGRETRISNAKKITGNQSCLRRKQ